MRHRLSIHEELRFSLIASCCTILLSMLVGCILWDRLPAELAVHFDFRDVPDSWAPKGFAVFGIPCIMLGLQAVCVFGSLHTAERQRFLTSSLLWLIPAISLVVSALLYGTALGVKLDVGLWTQVADGIMCIFLGNMMPKGAAYMRLGRRAANLPAHDKQRIARFWGYCLVGGGIAMCCFALSGAWSMFFAITLIVVVVPMVYACLTIRAAEGRA